MPGKMPSMDSPSDSTRTDRWCTSLSFAPTLHASMHCLHKPGSGVLPAQSYKVDCMLTSAPRKMPCSAGPSDGTQSDWWCMSLSLAPNLHASVHLAK